METLTDMIAGFLAGLTPGTRAQYRSVVSRWLRWCADNARWHPESGLSIPTREQWDDFLEELKSKGVDY